ncbi:unnamed protein product [Pleuronectes platessa]|uniref:Uncharacterized protein n=1 Tax=Pleuronectes platessa TaxID=8262 RepID=A0A9N7V9J3_PLEPL|nr:unnamed protein product [Pleuronectes platessa]
MEKENEKVLASGPKGDETAGGENSNYGIELQKGGGRDELEEREESAFSSHHVSDGDSRDPNALAPSPRGDVLLA